MAQGRSSATSPNIMTVPIIKPKVVPGNIIPHLYPYRQLPTRTSIRLLRLIPPPLDEDSFEPKATRPIKCSMEVVDLEDGVGYDALSYTWGDPLVFYRNLDGVLPSEDWYKPTFEIECDGYKLSVTANLYAALLSLQQIALLFMHPVLGKVMSRQGYSRAKYIWIDALCINQTDFDERASQVTLMRDIYRIAKAVICWLGGEDEASADAWNVMDVLCPLMSTLDGKLRDQLKAYKLLDDGWCRALGIPVFGATQWASVYAFLNRSWFKRAWIVQEISVNKNVWMLCGLKLTSGDMPLMLLEFLRSTRLIDQLHGLGEQYREAGSLAKDSALIRSLTGALDPSRISLFQSQPTNDWNHNAFLQVLDVRAGFQLEGGLVQLKPGASPNYLQTNIVHFFSTEASDPRDKIYAFLGLSKEFATDDRSWVDTGLTIEPNYKLSIRDVYINATAFMAVTGKNLKILSLVQDEIFRKQPDLPSWVPDFSGQNYPNAIDNGGPIPWNASEELGSFQISFPSTGVLNVLGYHIGNALELMDFDIEDFTHLGEITNVLKRLPQVSRIPSPPATQVLMDYILKGEAFDSEDFKGQENCLATMLSARTSMSASSAQSRIEILWRTLLTDRFEGYYPAPDTCKASVFHMIQESINETQIQIAQSFAAGDSSNVNEKLRALAIKCKSWKELQSLNLNNLPLPRYHPNLPNFWGL